MLPKSEIMRRGGYKCKTLEMHLQLRQQQVKTILYTYRLLYKNFRVTANQKSTTDTQTNKKNQLKYNTKDSHQTRRGENKKRREEKSNKNKSKTVNKMAIRTYISIITLNVNGLNAPTKRHRLAEWIQKQDLYICCLQETHFTSWDTYKFKVRGWKKIFHANRNQKKAGVAVLISDKKDFKMKNILRDKEGHYIMTKGSIQEEDITISNIYASNIGSPQHIRQLLTTLKGENDNNTIIVGDFNTPLTAMDKSSRHKINKETRFLNEALDQMDLILIGHSIQKQQNTHSSQVHMGHSLRLITSWATNQTSVTLRKLKGEFPSWCSG
uniref:exodeoxyribonuclease III n=1 Tax=Sus scrofa TaxID=9823 RepID=A0A8D1HM73_PIG